MLIISVFGFLASHESFSHVMSWCVVTCLRQLECVQMKRFVGLQCVLCVGLVLISSILIRVSVAVDVWTNSERTWKVMNKTWYCKQLYVRTTRTFVYLFTMSIQTIKIYVQLSSAFSNIRFRSSHIDLHTFVY